MQKPICKVFLAAAYSSARIHRLDAAFFLAYRAGIQRAFCDESDDRSSDAERKRRSLQTYFFKFAHILPRCK